MAEIVKLKSDLTNLSLSFLIPALKPSTSLGALW